jgi:hypothetical protein
MDFDYNTVKYLVIVLSFLIIGYVIFLIYTDVTNVRGELNKVKTRLFDTSVSLEELQKQIEYVDDNTDSENSNEEEQHVLHDILNNNFFTNEYTEVDPEVKQEKTTEDPVNINSFSFNIPFFTQNNEQQPLASIEEISESGDLITEDIPENFDQEIKFEKTLTQCQGVIASGKNKGNQCSKSAVSDSNFCTKHNK